MSILVAADFSDVEWAAWWPVLEAALPGETLLREVPGEREATAVEVALVANPPRASLSALPRLRLIQSL